MDWIPLNSASQLDEIIERSKEVPCLIFKHSTRCGISSMAKYRLEDDWKFEQNEIEPYYLDILTFRSISNKVAEKFAVHHESPQMLFIKDGECTFEASHLDITVREIKDCLV